MNNIEVKMKQVMAETRKKLDAEKNKKPDTNVRIANVQVYCVLN